MNFLEQICERAKKDMKTIVLPESEDIRTIKSGGNGAGKRNRKYYFSRCSGKNP